MMVYRNHVNKIVIVPQQTTNYQLKSQKGEAFLPTHLKIGQKFSLPKKPKVIVEKLVNMEDFKDTNVLDPIFRMGWGGVINIPGNFAMMIK